MKQILVTVIVLLVFMTCKTCGQTFNKIDSDVAMCKKYPEECLMSQTQRDTWLHGCFEGLCPGKNVSCVNDKQNRISVYFCSTYEDEMCAPGVYKEYTINQTAGTVTFVTLECPDGCYSDRVHNCTMGCDKSHLDRPDPTIYTLVTEETKKAPASLQCNTENGYCPENENEPYFNLTKQIYYKDFCKRVPQGTGCLKKEKLPVDQSTAYTEGAINGQPPRLTIVQNKGPPVGESYTSERAELDHEESIRPGSGSPDVNTGLDTASVVAICFSVIFVVGILAVIAYALARIWYKNRKQKGKLPVVVKCKHKTNMYCNNLGHSESPQDSNDSLVGSEQSCTENLIPSNTPRMAELKQTDSLGPLGNTERKEMY